MALVYQSPFPQVIKTSVASLTAANTGTRLAPTNVILLATAGTDGALVSRLEALPSGDVTATEIQIYSLKSGVYRLVRSLFLPAHTASTTTARPIVKVDDVSEDTPLYLEAGEMLYAALGVAQAGGVALRASWANY